MGILSKLFSGMFGEDERGEALQTWHLYLRDTLSRYSEDVAGQRVLIRNERLPGTREVALIIEMGLEDLGAQVVVTDAPYDWELQIWRFSGTEASYVLLDASGKEVDAGAIHHQQIVSRAIEVLAQHCRSGAC